MNKFVAIIAVLLAMPMLFFLCGEDSDGNESNMKEIGVTGGVDITFDPDLVEVYTNYTNERGVKRTNQSITDAEQLDYSKYTDISFNVVILDVKYGLKINNVDLTNFTEIEDYGEYKILQSNDFSMDDYKSSEKIDIRTFERSFKLFCYEDGTYTQKMPLITIGYDYTFTHQPTIDEKKGIWNTKSDGSGIDIVPGTNTASDAMMEYLTEVNGDWGFVLYPKAPEQVTINYNLAGGTNVSDTDIGYTWNSYTLISTMPMKDGFSFQGWEFDGTTYSSASMITLNGDTSCTIYAKWKLDTFTVDKCNVSITGGMIGESCTVTITPIDCYEIDTDTFRNESSDWALDLSSDAAVFTTDNLSSKPSFTIGVTPISYKLTLSTDGGLISDGWEEKVESRKYVNEYNVESGNIILPTPTKDGFTFQGWVDENHVSVKSLNGLNEDKTLLATWKSSGVNPQPLPDEPSEEYEDPEKPISEEYMITLYLDEDDLVPYRSVSSSSELPIPEKDGKEFVRWYVLTDDGKKDFDGNATSDVSLYAEWKDNESTTVISKELIIAGAIGLTVCLLGSLWLFISSKRK